MQPSDAGITALVSDEGSITYWYRDALGVWTIGVGHVGDPELEFTDVAMRSTVGGPLVREGRALTPAEVADLLRQDLPRYVAAVNSSVRVRLSQRQFDALVSFAFNWGVDHRYGFPATSVVALVNRGDFAAAAHELVWGKGPPHPPRWPEGRPYDKGLTGVRSRREREAAMLRAASALPLPLFIAVVTA